MWLLATNKFCCILLKTFDNTVLQTSANVNIRYHQLAIFELSI